MELYYKITKYKIVIIVILAFLLQILLLRSKTVLAANIDVIDSVKITNQKGIVQSGYRPGDRIRIDVKWSIKSEVKAGDTFSLKIPKELRGFNGTIKLNDKENRNFATGIGKDDLVIFTFSDVVEKLENIYGFFYIESQIRYIQQQGKIEVPLEFEIQGKVICEKIIIDTGYNTSKEYGEITEIFEKQGKINEKDNTLIDWALRINYKGEVLTDTIVIDTLKDGHEFVNGSLSLYRGYTNHETGEIEYLTKIPLEYPVCYDSLNNGFNLRFYIQGESYMLYYQTKITDKKRVDYKNRAILRAWNKKPIIKEVMIRSFACGGGASGEFKKYTGQLKIVKKDEITKELLLGAVFELINDENKVLAKLRTDENGEAITEKIPGGVYTLKEIEPPKGYVLDKESKIITLDFKENPKVEYIITNKKIEDSLQLVEKPAEDPEKPGEIENPAKQEDMEKPIDIEKPEEPIDIEKPKKVNKSKKSKKPVNKETLEEPTKPEKPLKQEKPSEIIIDTDDEVPLGGIDVDLIEPEKPVEVEKPVQVEKPIEVEKSDKIIVNADDRVPLGKSDVALIKREYLKKSMDVLPKTGEDSKQIFYLSGLLLMLLGFTLRRILNEKDRE